MTRLEQIMATITANGMREWTDERVKQAMQEYAKECAKASLEKASKIATVEYENGFGYIKEDSITSVDNIVLL